MFRSVRRVFLIGSLLASAAFLGLNIAMIASVDFYNSLSHLAQNLLPFSAVQNTANLKNSPKNSQSHLRRQNEKLKSKNVALLAKNKNLAMERKVLQDKANMQLKKTGESKKLIRGVSRKMQKRIAFNAARNISSIAAESLPVIGAGVVVIVTAYEIKDACENLKDLHQLAIAAGVEHGDDSEQDYYCGITIEDMGASRDRAVNPCDELVDVYKISGLDPSQCELPNDPTSPQPVQAPEIPSLPQDPTQR